MTEFNENPKGILVPKDPPPPPPEPEGPLASTPEYWELHALCPNCYASDFETTCVGYGGTVDGNRVRCGCGWTGIVHDLVPNMRVQLRNLRREVDELRSRIFDE